MSSAAQRLLAVIPAKGKSVRLPRKNVLPLGGRPLINWTIDAALASGVFHRVVVSTEDDEIAEVAEAAGAEVPFRRPEDLARDPAGVVQVALHALETLERDGDSCDEVCILMPTCPFRTAQDIVQALTLFRSRPEPNLMSVGAFDHTPFAAMDVDEDGLLSPHFPDYFGRKSQEMPAAYRPNGAIHILDTAWFREARSYLAPPVLAYVMPGERSVDIDSAEDLLAAEAMIARGNTGMASNG